MTSNDSVTLPDSLIDAIAHHQHPDRAEHDPKLVAQVHLGNILCISFGDNFTPKALNKSGYIS